MQDCASKRLAEWLHYISKYVMKISAISLWSPLGLSKTVSERDFFLNLFESEIHLDWFFLKNLTCLPCYVTKFPQLQLLLKMSLLGN